MGCWTAVGALSCADKLPSPPPGAPKLDLVVTKTVNKTTAAEGDTLVWTVSVHNAGPARATGLFAGDTLPTGTTYVSGVPSVGSYSSNGPWSIDTLAAGATAQLTLKGVIKSGTAGTNLVNTAGAYTAEENDTLLANNVASTSTAVTSATLNNLVFTTQPANTTAGTGFGVVVTAQNGTGGTVTSFTGTVTVAITSGTGTTGAHLSGTKQVTAVAGVATFSGLAVDSVGNGYTLQASSQGTNAGTSTSFNVAAGAPAQLVFATQPPNSASGAAFGTVVKAVDSQGNATSSFTGNVTVAIGANPGGGVLSGTKTVAAVASVATFSGLSIDRAGTGYTLTASASSMTGATSAAFNITAGTATKLAFTVQPSNVTAKAPFGTTVTAQDASGNTAAAFTGTVTVAITSGTGTTGANLTGTTSLSATAGVAVFSTLVIDTSGSGYTLTASASGLTSAISSAFSVAAPSASDEPVYNSATQTLVFQDNFDSYSTFADAHAGGWKSVDNSSADNFGATNDFTTDATYGANLIITGRGGTGKALRLKYDGKDNGSGQETHAWTRWTFDGVGAKVGHALYVQFWYRIVPGTPSPYPSGATGTGYNLDTDDGGKTANGHIIKVKWLELVASVGGGVRNQFNTEYSLRDASNPFPGASGTGTIFNFMGGSEIGDAQQVRPPWAYQYAGQWVRVTYKYMTPTNTSGSNDGIGQMWFNGTKIIDCSLASMNVPVPGAIGVDTHTGTTPTWCDQTAMNNFVMANDAVSGMRLGSVQTSGLWPFSIDYDDLIIWRD